MNKLAIVRVALVTLTAAVGCHHPQSTVAMREPRADAEVPIGDDAGMSARDAAVRDAATTPRTIADAASQVPSVDAQADLCAGTICVMPTHCESSGGFAHCACPAGMEFIDLGGDHSPCQAIPPGASADDAGDAADGG